MELHSLIGKYIRLPVSFWNSPGSNWAEEAYGEGWETKFDICKVTRIVLHKNKNVKEVVFKYTDDVEYSIPARLAKTYLEEGLFQGSSKHVFLSYV